MAKRTSRVCSMNEVLTMISDGDTIGIGGFVTSNKPWAFLRTLMRARKKDLTVVAAPSGLEIDLMAAMGLIKTLMTPYVGAEAIVPVGPIYK